MCTKKKLYGFGVRASRFLYGPVRILMRFLKENIFLLFFFPFFLVFFFLKKECDILSICVFIYTLSICVFIYTLSICVFIYVSVY